MWILLPHEKKVDREKSFSKIANKTKIETKIETEIETKIKNEILLITVNFFAISKESLFFAIILTWEETFCLTSFSPVMREREREKKMTFENLWKVFWKHKIFHFRNFRLNSLNSKREVYMVVDYMVFSRLVQRQVAKRKFWCVEKFSLLYITHTYIYSLKKRKIEKEKRREGEEHKSHWKIEISVLVAFLQLATKHTTVRWGKLTTWNFTDQRKTRCLTSVK